MSKKVAVDAEVSLSEAKAAMSYLATFGGAAAIADYLAPLRQFLAEFGTLQRFDYVVTKVCEALGKEAPVLVKEATDTTVEDRADYGMEVH